MKTLQINTSKEKLDTLWKTHGHIVENQAQFWAGKTGRDESDVWDACMDGFFKAAETWNPEGRASFKTWLTGGLRQRCRQWSQKEMKTLGRFPTTPLNEITGLITGMPLRQMIMDLGLGARTIVNLVLDLPEVFESLYKPEKKLHDMLLDLGWSGQEIQAAFDEIREELL